MRLPRTRQQEHNDFVRRMTGGTLYGRVRSAAPISPHTRPTRRTVGIVSAEPTHGTFYICTTTGPDGDSRLRRIDPDGNIIWENAYPDDLRRMDADPNGYLYVAADDFEMPESTVIKLDTDGNEIWKFAHGDSVYGVTADSDSNVYIAALASDNDGSHIRKLNPSGGVIWSHTASGNGRCVAVDSSRNVYCGLIDGSAIKLDSNGSFVWSVSFSNPVRGIAVDTNGNVFTANDRYLTKLDSDGSFVWEFDFHIDTIEVVKVDSDLFIYTAARDDKIKKVDQDGNQVWSFDFNEEFESLSVDSAGFTYGGTASNAALVISPDGLEQLRVLGESSTRHVEGVAVPPGSYTVAGHT